jgi:hypothetical protein
MLRTEGEETTKSRTQTDSGLKIGDRVRLIPDTLGWNAEIFLQGKIGEIVECREDGRVSIRFDNGRLLLGRQPGSFERVVGVKEKANEANRAR